MTHKRIIITGYFILLHLALGYIIYNPFIVLNQYWRFGLSHKTDDYLVEKIYQYHYATDAICDDTIDTLLLGDSHLHRMDTRLINPKVINWAVGNETIHHLNRIIKNFKSIKTAKNIIILAGVNDLIRHNNNLVNDYKSLIQKIPIAHKKFIITIPPVGKNFQHQINKEVALFNKKIPTFCHINNNCTIIDLYTALTHDNLHFLTSHYHYGDNIHLNKQAYSILAKLINHRLNQ